MHKNFDTTMRWIALLLFSLLSVQASAQSYNFEVQGKCAVIIASRASLSEVNDYYLKIPAKHRYLVSVFPSANGWYAISYGFVSSEARYEQIAQLVQAGEIPSDSFCSSGQKFQPRLATDRSRVYSYPAREQLSVIDLDPFKTVRIRPASARSADSPCTGISARVRRHTESGNQYNLFASGRAEAARSVRIITEKCPHRLAIDATVALQRFESLAEEYADAANERLEQVMQDRIVIHFQEKGLVGGLLSMYSPRNLGGLILDNASEHADLAPVNNQLNRAQQAVVRLINAGL